MALATYNNPILPGFNPDPSIIRHKDAYYLITSSFEYFPGIPIYHSTDLINWTLINHVLTRRSQLDIRTPEPGGGIWAPTLREHNGEFYVTVANYDRYRPQQEDRVWPRGFYVKTSDLWLRDGFSDPIYFDVVGFDQDLFWDTDGTTYLSTTYRKYPRTPVTPQIKDFAVHITTVDLTTGNSTSPSVLIKESASGIAEGSHILKRGKYYYLFTAEGGTEDGHCEWVARSEDGPKGPWEVGERNPLWRNGEGDEVQNTGHADFVEDGEGRWWAVFLGVRPVKDDKNVWRTSVFGRESYLVPMTWEDDWPVINGGQKVTLQSQGPGLTLKSHDPTWRDDFSNSELALGWYRKNTPTKIDFSTTGTSLRLNGGPYNLSWPTCPTMFLRKQTSRVGMWGTQLSFQPTSSRTEAGTVVWWNYFTYSSIGIRLSPSTTTTSSEKTKEETKRFINFRPAEGDVVEIPLRTLDAEVKLFIQCEELSYKFGFMEIPRKGDEKSITWVGEVSTDIMTTNPPVGQPFTGMMLGLYAFGEMEPCLAPADFRYAAFVTRERDISLLNE